MLTSIARTIFIIGLAVGGTLPVLAQSSTQSKADEPKAADDSELKLVGCVSGKPSVSGDYTFRDNVTKSEYRLTGKSMKKFAGQQVEIVSGKNKKLAIKGGLYPSPNIAAQAGALDPGQEAIARQPGGPSTGVGPEIPEFRVSQVRGVPGPCQ
jgi:hypothetical protein